MKRLSLIFIFLIVFGSGANAKEYLLYDDFTAGYSDAWRLYGWDNNYISMDIFDSQLRLGIGVGGSAYENSASSPYYSQATAGEIYWKDYTLAVDVRFEKTNFEYAGIMVRHRNASSYYALMFSKYGGYMALTKGDPYCTDGRILNGTKVSFSDIAEFNHDEFNRYAITVQGSNIKVSVNGARVIDYTDSENSYPAGMIGFNAYSTYSKDSYIYIDNVYVTDNSEPVDTAAYIEGIGKSGFALKNQSGINGDFDLLGAVYGKNKLLSVNKLDTDRISKGLRTSALPADNIGSAENARLFLWDKNMSPVKAAADTRIIKARNKYYVSQNAADGGDGSLEQPFNSLEKARDTIRLTKNFVSGDIEVIITDDIYFLEKTFELYSDDSGTAGRIIYKGLDGKRPVISAGTRIEGFTLCDSEKNIYRASAKGLNFRQMYTKNRSCIRARYPDNGRYLRIQEWGEASASINEQPPLNDYNGAEAVIQKVWGNDILKVQNITDNVMTFDEKSTRLEFENANPPRQDNQAFHLENKYEFIDNEGEWFLDTVNDVVYCKPFSDDDLSQIYVPVIETAVCITGEGLNDRVTNISFENISFAHTDWNYPKENPYVEVQSQQYFDGYNYKSHPVAGVYVKNAENIEFNKVRFYDMGSTALDLHHGVSDCIVSECAFFNIGGNGISIGIFDSIPNYTGSDMYVPVNEKDITRNISVNNCFITRVGQSYFSSAGILAGKCSDVDILNNEICDLPWSGISLSWGWSSKGSLSAGFNVRYNHIYNVLNKVSDGGGIYFCGNASGSVVSDNYIHNLKYAVYASGAMLTAVYLDTGTKGVSVYNNSVYQAPLFHSNANEADNNVEMSKDRDSEIEANSGIKSAGVKDGIIYEIARGKKASASSYWSEEYAPVFLTDGSANNNARWIMNKSDTAPWVQVDLGDSYFIRCIKLDSTLWANYSTEEFRREFDVLASDSEEFEEYNVIASQGSTSWTMGEQWIKYMHTVKPYRYIRIRKKQNTFFELSEITVYGCKGEEIQ